MPKIKICFCAIFKNESKNVYRCLNAVKNIIDCVSICDTGSTDNTIELINQWGQDNNIPCTVHHGPDQVFKNFGHNRSLSYNYAVKTYPTSDYVLLIDADMVLVIEPTFDKNSLKDDHYLFQQVTNELKYYNTRLISTKYEWKCRGVTHEYWDANNDKITRNNFKDIWINDIGDGGCKENKFKRDIRLLTEGLENSNESYELKNRYMFYLAQSYKDIGDYENSIKWYLSRAKHKGYTKDVYDKYFKSLNHYKDLEDYEKDHRYKEEVFYCYFYVGENYRNLGEKEKSVGFYLESWNYRPQRAEPLYELANMYRLEKDKQQLAMLFAKKAITIPYPKNDGLFVRYKVYEYKILEEISICAWYTNEKALGKAICEKLLSMKDKIPNGLYERTLKNYEFYKK